ncbi:helix-turn-helix transcriptional regulator [Candidatus Halobeggiatoa sp. HSG11]|nr:helix-turn-helix transcriptional regulator [Candidatus Halobeggiatoa sp. HSG11]
MSNNNGNDNGFGERLKIERKRLDFSQVELAKLIGVSPKTVSNYEIGKYQTPLMNMLKEGVDIGYLITGIRTNPECLEQLRDAIRGKEPKVSTSTVISLIKQYLEYLR